jgi:hypothetical protein
MESKKQGWEQPKQQRIIREPWLDYLLQPISHDTLTLASASAAFISSVSS